MPTAYSYARFSSDRQHESSIEAQQDATRAWAKARGVTILREFCDRGISGTTDERPEFQNMIAACRIRKVDFVLVHKHDRFARNRYDAAIYGRIIEKAGARLVAVAQDFGDAPEAMILEGLMQAWSEYYSRNLSTEVKKGLRVRAQKGQRIGGQVPFGYREQDGVPVIREDEAVWVRRWFEGYAAGKSVLQMGKEAAAAGVRGTRGSPMRDVTIHKVLRNPWYIGVYQATLDGKEYRFEGHHPAIVPIELWKECQSLMEARTNSRRAAGERTYLLVGLVRCGICGAHMRGHTQVHGGVEYPSYYCSEKHGDGKSLRSIRTDVLDEAVRQYIRGVLTPEAQAKAARILTEYGTGRRQDAAARGPEAKKRIRQLEKKIDALMENMSSGVLPPSVLQRMGGQITALETEIEAQRAILDAPPDPEPVSIEKFFADAAEISEDTPIEEAQAIVRRFVKQVTVTNDEIQIDSTFLDWLAARDPAAAVYIKNHSQIGELIFDIKIPRDPCRRERLLFDIGSMLLFKLLNAA